MHTLEPEPLTRRFAAPSPRLRGEGRGEGSGDASEIKIMKLALTEQYWG